MKHGLYKYNCLQYGVRCFLKHHVGPTRFTQRLWPAKLHVYASPPEDNMQAKQNHNRGIHVIRLSIPESPKFNQCFIHSCNTDKNKSTPPTPPPPHPPPPPPPPPPPHPHPHPHPPPTPPFPKSNIRKEVYVEIWKKSVSNWQDKLLSISYHCKWNVMIILWLLLSQWVFCSIMSFFN